MAGFTPKGFAPDIVDSGKKEDMIRTLAEYCIVPKKNAWRVTSFGKSNYTLERRGNTKPGSKSHAVGTQTRKSIIKTLEITSDEECEEVREEIKNHPMWGAKDR